MYNVNCDPVSNSETWQEDMALVDADDLTGIDAARDGVTVILSVWSRVPRGIADQSQIVFLPSSALGTWVASPAISASTDDGTGRLTLSDGVLLITIPVAEMSMLRPGFYQFGITMKNYDQTTQLVNGTIPIYEGLVA